MPSQILNHTVQRFRTIGIIPTDSAWRRYRFVDGAIIRLALHALASVLVLLPQIALMVFRAADVVEVMQVFYSVVTVTGGGLQFLSMARRRDDIQLLLADMQRFVDAISASNADTAERFRRTEKSATFFCRTYERLSFLSLALYLTMPIVLQYFGASHTPRADDVGFVKDLYFFNVSHTPMRELCYSSMIVCHVLVILSLVSIDLFYCEICLYLVAMYKEMQEMLRYMDKQYQPLTNGALVLTSLRCSFIKCIEFHDAIIRFTDTINNIFGHTIFVQFAYSLLVICGIVLEALNTSRSNMIEVVMLTTCLVVEPFLFCLFGELVLTEANNLLSTEYEMQWFEFSITEQRMIFMMLMQTQKRCGLAAYNYFNCDLETFFQIMSHVYAVLTFLQSMI